MSNRTKFVLSVFVLTLVAGLLLASCVPQGKEEVRTNILSRWGEFCEQVDYTAPTGPIYRCDFNDATCYAHAGGIDCNWKDK